MKTTINFNQNSTLLSVEGLPDNSLGHEPGTIGIISSWKLQLLGTTEIEGKREHLQSLIQVLLPYIRYRITGNKRSFESENSSVTISPNDENHRLVLRSSKPEVKPLTLQLDDADLADIIRCLDELLADKRIKVNWNISNHKILSNRNLNSIQPLYQMLSAPFVALGSIFLISLVSLNSTDYFSNQNNQIIYEKTESTRNK